MATTTAATTTTTTTTAGMSSTSTGSIAIGLDSLPTYDGTTSIDEFLTVVEGTGALANWNDGQLIAITFLKLRNKAKQFIDSEPTLRSTTDWNIVKSSLRNQFKRQYVKGAAIKNFIECRQRNNESCRQYLTRLKLLGNRTVTLTGDVSHDETVKNKLEEDVTTQFMLGLLMPIKQRVLSGDPQSLELALKIAEREESIENLIHPSHQRMVTSTNQPNLDSYARNKFSKPMKCYKCQKEGHTANYCKAKDIRVCFKCHKQGHISPNCPQKNLSTKTVPNNRGCFTCGNPEHFARNCLEQRNQAGGSARQGLNSNAAEVRPRYSAENEANWE